MTYRVFISTTHDAMTTQYVSAVKQGLWQLNDFPVAPMTMEDLALSDQHPEALIRQALDDTDIFIGIYGNAFGEYAGLDIAAIIEYEYSYAIERGLSPIIFMPANTDDMEDRMAQFRATIETQTVIHSFRNEDELKAKIVVAVTNFRMQARKRPSLKLPHRELSASQEQAAPIAEDDQFEQTVQRAFNVVEDDLTQLIERVIAVQEAKAQLQPPDLKGAGHEIMVNPIFGEPNKNVQFQSDIFMIMPFREEYDMVYQNVIVPTVESLNLTIKRGDEFSSVSGQIMSEVWAALNACKLVIVETSVENANVYYELGIAHTLGKPAILITQGKDIEDFPFDIRHLRFIVYENSIVGGDKLEEDLRKSIIWILNDLEDGL